MNLGKFDDALQSLERGLAQLPPGPGQLRSTGLMNIGAIHSFQGDYSAALDYDRRALAIARRRHDSFQEFMLLSNQGGDKFDSGYWNGALEDMQEALRLAEKLGSERLVARANAELSALCTDG